MLKDLEQIDGLNIDKGLRNAGYSAAIYTQLLAHFIDSCLDYHQQLSAAAQEKNSEHIRSIIHKLYGVSELLGVELISQDCNFLLSFKKNNKKNQLVIEERLEILLIHLDAMYTQHQDKAQVWSKN